MKLKHIDNSFYRLTGAQAKSLTIGNELPKPGYERDCDRAKLEGVKLLHRRCGNWVESSPSEYGNLASATVKRTALSYHDGKEIKQGWTWALHLYFTPSI